MVEHQPGGVSSACVDAATIAAFVDGTLDATGRARVVSHLASCPDCSELVGEVIRTDEDLAQPLASPESSPDSGVSPGKVLWMRRRGLAAVGGLVAIAASLVLLFLNRGAPLDPLVAIVGDERLILARPTGGFHYGPLRSAVRGSGDAANLQLAAEVMRLRERAERTKAAGDLHAYGVAQLVAGDINGAIDALQSASRLTPDEARTVADLGAAYMTRFVARGDQRDATAALDALDQALSLSPSVKEAWFNRALLLEQVNRPSDALAAWSKYLELTDDQAWRDEAVRRRDELQRRSR